jgi:hypothetical protein
MKAIVNTHAINTTVFDSANLGVLGTICHPILERGEYAGMIYRNDKAVGRFTLQCDPECAATQVDIDLATFTAPGADPCSHEMLTVKPEGFLVLYVSTGRAGYHVTLHPQMEKHRQGAYDSRKLQDHDLFVATLIRPGHYEMSSTLFKERGGVTVSYPEPGKVAQPTQQAAMVECSAKGFSPSAVKLMPAQGLIFKIQAANAAIRINLQKPDDGPCDDREKKPLRSVHWDNPASTGEK